MTAGAVGDQIIGSRVRRVDAAEKLTGLSRFSADLSLPGMLFARLALSPYAHARINGFDTSETLALPGVVAAVTAEDLEAVIKVEPSSRARAMLAHGETRYCGEPVAVVLAESEAAAEDGVTRLIVDYEELPAIIDPIQALDPSSPIVWPDGFLEDEGEGAAHGLAGGGPSADAKATNISSTANMDRGDVDAGFAEADVTVERTYRIPIVHQGYIEPHASVAAVDLTGRITIWTMTQGIWRVMEETAATLGLASHQLKVVPMPVGGGFGGKTVLLEPLAAALAMTQKRPVQVALTRIDEFLTTTPSPQAVIKVKLGAKKDGTLTALDSEVVFDAGMFPGPPMANGCLMVGAYYQVPNLRIRGYEVVTNKSPQGAYRAPGAVQGTYAIESAIEELARKLHLDPIEIRLKNVSMPGDPLPNGAKWAHMGLKQVLEALQDHPAWKNRTKDPNVGYGVAVGGWMGGAGPGAATTRLESDGTLSVILGSVDVSGTNTGIALIAAEAFGIPFEKVRVVNADSDTAPFSGMAGGSKITLTIGSAVSDASADARRQVLAIAADQLEASPEDLNIVNDHVEVYGAPERTISLSKLASMTMSMSAKYPPVQGRGTVAITARNPGIAAHLATVRVDPDTKVPRVISYVAVQDVGKIINPSGIEDQIHGGVAQGIGRALYEDMVYDEDGRLLAGSLLDYALPNSHQIPNIDVVMVENPGQAAGVAFGLRGVGEPPIVPVAAAVANAVADASGFRVTELPVTAERVFRASEDGVREAQ
jgi:CO/xanthine dehydrogenase Mo-binding subunit